MWTDRGGRRLGRTPPAQQLLSFAGSSRPSALSQPVQRRYRPCPRLSWWAGGSPPREFLRPRASVVAARVQLRETRTLDKPLSLAGWDSFRFDG